MINDSVLLERGDILLAATGEFFEVLHVNRDNTFVLLQKDTEKVFLNVKRDDVNKFTLVQEEDNNKLYNFWLIVVSHHFDGKIITQNVYSYHENSFMDIESINNIIDNCEHSGDNSIALSVNYLGKATLQDFKWHENFNQL